MIPKLLIIPLLTGFITQMLKYVWHAAAGRLEWRSINLYGGMPSTHTAISVSLVNVIGLSEGLFSPEFAISVIVALLVVRDAVGFRRYLGGHSRALNVIVKALPVEEQNQFHRFRERLGHTPLEAFVGGIVGFALSSVFYLVIP